MSSEIILNGAGQVVNRGVHDVSGTTPSSEAVPVPQHCPKFYLRAAEGKTAPKLHTAASRVRAYGEDTFKPTSKYFNMSTLFANLAASVGNNCVLQRIVADDAAAATIRIGVDYIAKSVPNYQRDAQGRLVLDQVGGPVVHPSNPTIPQGLELMWRKEVIEDGVNTGFGVAAQKPGLLVDGETQSTFLPLLDFKVYSEGAFGDLCGISIEAPTELTSVVPDLTKLGAFPFFLQLFRKSSATATPKTVKTVLGDESIRFFLKPNMLDEQNQLGHLNDVYLKSYQSLNSKYPDVYALFDQLHVYQANFETLLDLIWSVESDNIAAFSDVTADSTSKYLINPFTLLHSSGAPYVAAVFADPGTDGIVLGKNKIIYAAGGSDGDLTVDAYETKIRDDLARYNDPDDEYTSMELHPEKDFYDCGFSFANGTKAALAQVMGVRKDTQVWAAVLVEGEGRLTESVEHARAQSLLTRFRAFPESDYYGTECYRATLYGRDYTLYDTTYTKRVPILYDVLLMNAKHRGAADGKWKNANRPDGDPGNILRLGSDINIPWIGTSIRNRNWDAGINWVLPSDNGQFFIPHHRTIYGDDTSIINSATTASCVAWTNRISNRAWQRFVGRRDLTELQLKAAVESFVNQELSEGVFGPEMTIVPECIITAKDSEYGYRWRLKMKVYGPNMVTVMITWTETYRNSSLAATV